MRTGWAGLQKILDFEPFADLRLKVASKRSFDFAKSIGTQVWLLYPMGLKAHDES